MLADKSRFKDRIISDSQVKNHMHRLFTAYSFSEKQSSQKPELLLGLPGLGNRNPYLIKLAAHIHEKPYLLTSERYRDLEWSIYRGNVTKNLLLKHGYIREHELWISKWAKGKLLSLTRKGKQALLEAGYSRARLPQHGSLEHEFWKRRVLQFLEKQGWECRLEQDNVDLVAVKSGRAVHVEVETGKSDPVRNARKSIKKPGQVLMLATNIKALKRVKTKLSDAGLLSRSKLRLELVQDFIRC